MGQYSATPEDLDGNQESSHHYHHHRYKKTPTREELAEEASIASIHLGGGYVPVQKKKSQTSPTSPSTTEDSESIKVHRKCKKHRESRQNYAYEEQPRYQNLEEANADEEHAKKITLKALEKERRRQVHRQQQQQQHRTVASPRVEESKRKKHLQDLPTEPVYMPRSKYYPEPEENSTDVTDKSSSASEQHHHQRHHHSKRPSARPHHQRLPSRPAKIEAADEDSDINFYIGPKTPSQVVKHLKPNEFRIYYQIPEKGVSFKLRLFLAYMSSQNKEVFHFPIVCTKNSRTGENMWSLRYTDSATFPSLPALIKYHKTYAYMDPATGKIDTFPVWKGAIIDDDTY